MHKPQKEANVPKGDTRVFFHSDEDKNVDDRSIATICDPPENAVRVTLYLVREASLRKNVGSNRLG